MLHGFWDYVSRVPWARPGLQPIKPRHTLFKRKKKLKQYWGLGSLCLWVGPGLQPINLEIICSVFVIIRIHKKRANLVPKVKALGRTWCHD